MGLNFKYCQNIPNVETENLSIDNINFETTKVCIKIPSVKTYPHTRTCADGDTPTLFFSAALSSKVMDVPLDLNPFDKDEKKLLVDLGIWIGFENTPNGVRVWMGSEEAGVCINDEDPKNKVWTEDIATLAETLLNQLENYYKEDAYDLIFTAGAVVVVALIVLAALAIAPEAGIVIAGSPIGL